MNEGAGGALPAAIPPMLATGGGKPFDSPDFLFEVKWDGVRCLAFLDRGTRLQSRRLNDITRKYPELAGLHRVVDGQPAVLDGEIITLTNGKPDFAALLSRHRTEQPARIRAAADLHPATFVAFDLLYLKGRNIMGAPLFERRELLTQLFTETGQLVLSRHVAGAGAAFAETVFARGLEGVMAKRVDSPYLPGKRTKDWLKVKQPRRLEGVIAGFGYRSDGGVGSVTIGLYDPAGQLKFAGQAGVSLPTKADRELLTQLRALVRPEPALGGVPREVARAVQWVQPRLTCQVEYLERSRHGLRHAVYRGLVARAPETCTLDQLNDVHEEEAARL